MGRAEQAWRPSAHRLVSLEPGFLANALASQGFLHSPLLAWFQVEGVTLNLLNYVFLLNLAFEAAKCVF
jgi:hypothetical protein